MATRVDKLVAAGLSKEDAEKKSQDLLALSDEQFDLVASVLASVKPPVVPGTQTPPGCSRDTRTQFVWL